MTDSSNPFLLPPGSVPPPPPVQPVVPVVPAAAPLESGTRRIPAPPAAPVTGKTPVVEPIAARPEARPRADEPSVVGLLPTAPAGWRVVTADGVVAPLTSSILLGRNPAHRAEWPKAGLLEIDDPDKTVSKTHAVVELVDGSVRIRDLSSTNGTTVVAADGTRTVLVAGVDHVVDGPVDLLVGSYRVELARS